MDVPEYPQVEFATITKIQSVNFTPHPFTVGPRHIAYANKEAPDGFGILGPKTCEAVPCQADIAGRFGGRKCGLPYSAHHYDTVACVKLTRNVTNAEMLAFLVAVKAAWTATGHIGKPGGIDGFIFLDTPEHYRVAKPTAEEKAAGDKGEPPDARQPKEGA